MAYQKEMLFRDSLSDTGGSKQHGSYCSSPDMIVHSLVRDAEKAFGKNYAKDPNERVNRSSRTNAIYTRVKSMQESDEPIIGYIRLYRANSSLFMNTDQWKDNKLRTPKGREYVTVTTAKAGEIAVGDDILLIDGTAPNFCIVGIVNTSVQETLPGRFSSYSDFVMWVHRERCVAVRNFSLEASGRKADYESLYYVANPETRPRLGCICVEAEGLPKGTVIGVENKAMGINKSIAFDPAHEMGKNVTDSAVLEAGFEGYVKIYAYLPKGKKWPAGAFITTSFMVNAEEREEMVQFAVPVNQTFLEWSSLSNFDIGIGGGRLVKVGECKTVFR